MATDIRPSPSPGRGSVPVGEGPEGRSRPVLAAGRPATSWRQDLVTVLLATWLVVGVFVDGWAHNNLARLETFFTPWHALFYSGFTATALWVLRLVTANLAHRPAGRSWPDAVPVGYGLGLAGLGLFAVAGAADMVWHTVLGIEVSIDALLSPPHLALLAGAAMILTSPLRAAWARLGPAPGFGELLPALLSLTLLASLAAFFFQYLSPWMSGYPTAGYAERVRYLESFGIDYDFAIVGQILGVGAIVITNLIVLAPLLYLLRRWRTPFGTATFLVTAVAALSSGIMEFEFPELVAAALAGGLAIDLLVARLRPGPARRGAFLATAGLIPVALWATCLAALAVVRGLGWPVELWFGVVVLAALSGLALGLLMAPAPAPYPRPDYRELPAASPAVDGG
jgi:hypothetical protein